MSAATPHMCAVLLIQQRCCRAVVVHMGLEALVSSTTRDAQEESRPAIHQLHPALASITPDAAKWLVAPASTLVPFILLTLWRALSIVTRILPRLMISKRDCCKLLALAPSRPPAIVHSAYRVCSTNPVLKTCDELVVCSVNHSLSADQNVK